MENEYYYLNQLENKMSDFLEEEIVQENILGWIPPNMKQRMAEAAWAVVKNNKDLNDYLEEQKVLKNG